MLIISDMVNYEKTESIFDIREVHHNTKPQALNFKGVGGSVISQKFPRPAITFDRLAKGAIDSSPRTTFNKFATGDRCK